MRPHPQLQAGLVRRSRGTSSGRIGVTAAAGLLTASLALPEAHADTFAANSLVIPMDTTYQNSGMFKAYGLVYRLLRNGVPVRWTIKSGKTVGQSDFTATGVDFRTGAAVNGYAYRGGPFVIDAANAGAATPIIQAWQTANPTTTVHRATVAFTADVAKYLVVAPNVAMFADGNQDIARGYLVAAGIPDSTGNTAWPNTSPDMLDPAEVSGPTIASHRDGKLFDADGDPVYCQFMSMHWGVNNAVQTPEVVAEVRSYLESPVHFFAECQAVNAFENATQYGFFLTENGYDIAARPNNVSFHHADSPFAQIDGAFETVGGSEPAYKLPPGDSYKAGGVTMITAQGFQEGQWDLWMTGYLDGACSPMAESCNALGKVSYLGGHKYETKVPISQNPDSQGTRLFLNSLFDSNCATASGLPVVTVAKSAPASTTVADVTFTLAYRNAGPSVALAATLSDPLPNGTSFVSATNGGTLVGSTVQWNLGNLGVSESGTVEMTVHLPSFGSYANTASLAYRVGLNPFTISSNTTTTTYDVDTDLDGIVDSIDICPNDYNPSQDLTSDVDNCGGCGDACDTPNATAQCVLSTCGIVACDLGFVDCDGAVANGCEYDEDDFDVDEQNCGGCGSVCAPANATGECLLGLCGIGTCSPTHDDCNGNAADGCEYEVAGFSTDPQNCGSCGNACNTGFVCTNGACVVDTCPAGFADCNGTPADGCEYATTGFATDEQNCGGCGLVCDPPSSTGNCVAGTCTIGTCDPGRSDCNGLPGDGCEYVTTGFDTDPQNCGGCGIACDPDNATGVCVGGDCEIGTCVAGYEDCNGLETDGCEYDTDAFATDGDNCGGCGVQCDPANGTGVCVAGVCEIGTCVQGFSDCDGNPANGCEYDDTGFDTDEQNCGDCGSLCDPPAAVGLCVAGSCTVGSCDPGFIDLDGNPANGCETSCTPSAASDTTCDGIDDDCDGNVDDDFVPGTCGTGACERNGACVDGVYGCAPGSSETEGPPGSPECTDAIDNDCDGDTDDLDTDCTECDSASDCDDGDACTIDDCIANACDHQPDPSCASGGGGEGGAGGSTSDGGAAQGGAAQGGEAEGGRGEGGAVATGGGGAVSGGNSAQGGGPSEAGSDAGGSIGDGDADGPGDDGGCDCRLAAGRSGAASQGWVALLSLLLVSRRRRRGTAHPSAATRHM